MLPPKELSALVLAEEQAYNDGHRVQLTDLPSEDEEMEEVPSILPEHGTDARKSERVRRGKSHMYAGVFWTTKVSLNGQVLMRSAAVCKLEVLVSFELRAEGKVLPWDPYLYTDTACRNCQRNPL